MSHENVNQSLSYLSKEKKNNSIFYPQIHYGIETHIIVKLRYNRGQISGIVKPRVEI